MNEFDNNPSRDAFFSKRIRAGKRTYYFDVKATRASDFYITITESKRKPGESEDRPFFEKHKLFLYKEDFDKFSDGLQEALQYIREKNSGQQSDHSYHEAPRSAEPEIENEAEPIFKSSLSDFNFEDLGK